MKSGIFSFIGEYKDNFNQYLLRIKDKEIRGLVANFFEKSVISSIPKKEVEKLIDAINADVEKGIFKVEKKFTGALALPAFHTMSIEQQKSQTHKLFMGIVKNHFGKSAHKTLRDRKNLNIFNLNEVHVLHQEIFDTFGETFVNKILNLDLRPHSLTLIKDLLTDPNKKKDFKYFYDFYNKNIGNSPVDFDRMIKGFNSYQEMVRNLRTSGKKVSSLQTETLIEILKNPDNPYNINSSSKVDKFYEIKQKEYLLNKNKARGLARKGNYEGAIETHIQALFKNYYGMSLPVIDGAFSTRYYMNSNNARMIRDFFDLDSITNNPSIKERFTSKEIKQIRKIIHLVDMMDGGDCKEDYEEVLKIAEELEKSGNKVDKDVLGILDKLPKVFSEDITKSISTIETIEKRAKSSEKGIHVDKNPVTKEGSRISNPVYVLEGADFSFLSTSNLLSGGLSRNQVISNNFAASWFEYENGTSHISASYSNQDCLSNIEFSRNYRNTDKVTYLLEDVSVLTMGPMDIYSPSIQRVSNVYSEQNTKFMSKERLVEQFNDEESTYTEVDVSRSEYDREDVRFGGKIIPAAILCNGQVTDLQLSAAEDFTKFCVENGLREEGWKMPLVVVKKEVYDEISKKKKQGLIAKNSEYFLEEEKKVEEKIEEEKKKLQEVQEATKDKEVVSEQSTSRQR